MDHYYDRANLRRIPELIALAPQAASSFLAFERDVYDSAGSVDPLTKELIAVAVAHVVGCPYCIDVHVKKYQSLGGSPAAAMEAVLVAASTRAGAVLSHATHMLHAFETTTPATSPDPKQDNSSPDCFC
ncbi:AhpD family alkylhydroperoxidase [Paenibacillus phyllosphaerae]|uniref:AhpD family alkylhydroperoxidase n=1 Tax=Paenibacillus phyllosphaerae TaxID=274593 RepID=A0A7W5FQ82_9BACL|nr:carboxymuconolactone decarboxylase family protein [Paenibacillus phyllosphaerae]MBB3113201.1 AhpD family alkylhydroperoxidase [Paenibacillus phyllosphaerae]